MSAKSGKMETDLVLFELTSEAAWTVANCLIPVPWHYHHPRLSHLSYLWSAFELSIDFNCLLLRLNVLVFTVVPVKISFHCFRIKGEH